MRRLGQVTLGVMIAVSAGVVTPMRVAAQSYPIDCAILLCMAGGFPASAVRPHVFFIGPRVMDQPVF